MQRIEMPSREQREEPVEKGYWKPSGEIPLISRKVCGIGFEEPKKSFQR